MNTSGDVPFTAAALSLAVILALLALAAWAARRLRGGFALGQSRNASIAIIATRVIGPQASLMIVEAERQRFFVGTGRAGITAIVPLGAAPEAFETMLARATPAGDEA